MERHLGLTEQNCQEISKGLSHFLADVYTTYLKTQNFHWNLSGREFYSLHLLFEKQYQELAEETDEVAERIRALGFYVEASFTSFKQLTHIKEEENVLTIKDMLHRLIAAHEMICRHGRNVSRLAEKGEDVATVDMLGRRIAAHEKMIWMLRSSE